MTEKNIDIIAEGKKVLSTEAAAIEAIALRLDDSFAEAVHMIGAGKGRVIVTGMGKSGLVGKKIAATMASTGTPAFYMHPGEASHGDLGMVTPDDIVLALSNSGDTEEVVALIPFIKRFKIGLISMTGGLNSALAQASDIVLDVAVDEEACPMGIVPTASTTAALALGDALAVALIVEKGFKREDFAQFHPSGALGKKLLTRVSDLMRSGEAMPSVSQETTVADAIIEISSKRLGCTAVVNEAGALVGVLTDGDLRRGLGSKGQEFFALRASEAMTVSPKTIESSALAVTALAAMEEHSITVLLVVDPDNSDRPVGVLHIHDILREGIA